MLPELVKRLGLLKSNQDFLNNARMTPIVAENAKDQNVFSNHFAAAMELGLYGVKTKSNGEIRGTKKKRGMSMLINFDGCTNQ